LSKLPHIVLVALTQFVQTTQISVWGPYTHLSKLEEKITAHFHFTAEAWNLTLSKLLHLLLEILINICPNYSIFCWRYVHIFVQSTPFYKGGPYKYLSILFRIVLVGGPYTICPSYSNFFLRASYTFVQTRTEENSALPLPSGRLKSRVVQTAPYYYGGS